jgi:hypothetical protein
VIFLKFFLCVGKGGNFKVAIGNTLRVNESNILDREFEKIFISNILYHVYYFSFWLMGD